MALAPTLPQADVQQMAKSHRDLADQMEHLAIPPASDGAAAILAALNTLNNRVTQELADVNTRVAEMNTRLTDLQVQLTARFDLSIYSHPAKSTV